MLVIDFDGVDLDISVNHEERPVKVHSYILDSTWPGNDWSSD